jgi:hypothetical protein
MSSNPKNKKVMKVLTGIFVIVVILGMILLYAPALITGFQSF